MCNEMTRSPVCPLALLCRPRDTDRGADLCVDGGREVAQQPHVILLAGLHVHHEAGVQVAQLGGLGE